LVGAVAAIGAVALLTLGMGTPSALADLCPNATLREDNGSTELPDCRAYEMVSPSYKQGFGAIPGLPDNDSHVFNDDGIVAFSSGGSFAGNGFGGLLINPYLGVRTAAGWETQALYPPLYRVALQKNLLASDMRSWVTLLDPGDQSGNGNGFYVRDLDGGLTRVGQGPIPGEGDALAFLPGPELVSDDLSHLVFVRGVGLLWEYVGVGAGAVVRRVNVDNHGDSLSEQACSRDISGDGRVVVFGLSTCEGGGSLWARVDGTVTVAVSGSECTRGPSDLGGSCNGASAAALAGGAVDGSRLFFTTEQQLVDGDRDVTRDLYACDIPAGSPAPVGDANSCETLTEVSGSSDGAGVEGVVSVSEDGSRVYFVARGVLAGNPGVGGGAVAGTDQEPHQNLYLWTKDAAHPAGQIRFVAGVDGGISGGRMAGGDRYLVFSTPAALVSSGPGADEDGGADVYRYDAESETVLRLSTSVSGSGGNGSGFDAGGSSVSADGSMVVFGTAEGLSPSDTDGVSDVYLWREGRVSRISRGGGRAMGISSTGRDVYFVTDQRLVAADGDVNTDVYDARVGGGFTLSSGSEPCSGRACQGPSSAPPGIAAPAAGSGEGSEVGVVPVVSLRAVSAAERRQLAATGRLTVTVSANTAGMLRVAATATIGGRSSTVASGRQAISGPGSVRIALTLSKKARRQLAVRGRLAVRLTVSHSKVALARSVTLRLAHAKAKGGRS
jgi:Tol biopolymer transport system component